ncbi:MAG: hypothetical protein DWQ06_00850 [Calditrichaeota bacterium]|nr:MAG: hypothetical protein DWQ06_00850 [Calditrichota bacterium]
MIVKVAEEKDYARISKLRIEAYKKATGMKISDNSFLFFENDKRPGIVLFVEDESGNAISTLKGVKVTNIEELEKVFDIKIHSDLEFPVFVFEKLATAFEFRRNGISRILRIIFFEYCLKSKIKNITLTAQEDASRIKLLKKMGYKIEIADISQRKITSFDNSSRAVFAVLNCNSFERAIEVNKQDFDLKKFEFDESVKTLLS